MHAAHQDDLRATFGATVRRRRAELGLSQVELAERLGDGLGQSELSRIERGHLPWPRPDLIERLAHGLQLSPLELLRQSGWMSDEDYTAYTAATPHSPLSDQ